MTLWFRLCLSSSSDYASLPQIMPLFLRLCLSSSDYASLPQTMPLFLRLCLSSSDYASLPQTMPLFLRLCLSSSDYASLPQTMPLFLRLCLSSSDYASLPQTMPLFLRLCLSSSDYASLPQTMPLFLRLCLSSSDYASLPQTMPLFLRLCHHYCPQTPNHKPPRLYCPTTHTPNQNRPTTIRLPKRSDMQTLPQTMPLFPMPLFLRLCLSWLHSVTITVSQVQYPGQLSDTQTPNQNRLTTVGYRNAQSQTAQLYCPTPIRPIKTAQLLSDTETPYQTAQLRPIRKGPIKTNQLLLGTETPVAQSQTAQLLSDTERPITNRPTTVRYRNAQSQTAQLLSDTETPNQNHPTPSILKR